MTGFGAAEGSVGGARVSVEIRSVNHRFFSPAVKLPSELAKWEGDVRDALRAAVSRGHVTVTARLDRTQVNDIRIDVGVFEAYVQQLRALQQRFNLANFDVGAVLRLPNVVATSDGAAEGSAAELIAVVNQALGALDAMRVAEGARLVAYVRERLDVLAASAEAIAHRAPDRVVEQRERLREAVRELSGGIAVDEQRIAQEIAILADRLDVSEEISRFRSHLSAFRDALEKPPADGVGKRLGFLLQELLREANTAGSKGNDSTILRDVLVIKEELEKLREQVENLE